MKTIYRVSAFLTVLILWTNISSYPVHSVGAEKAAVKPAISDIKADSYIVIDMNTGNTLMEYNADKIIHPASLTKIITAIVAIENVNEDDVITTSQYAGSLSDNQSKIDLIPGEKMSFRDMFFGMMIGSGNDAATAIAEHVSGSISAFSLLMNQKSEELGAENSVWTNPSGITETGHSTTSRDLAVITRYAFRSSLFREAAETYYYSLPVTNKHLYSDWNVIENTNKLMRFQEIFYAVDDLYEIKGVKTGTTTAAGSNLIVTAHAKNGLELICVINGVRGDYSKYIWSYTVALLEGAAKIEEGVRSVFKENSETALNTGNGTKTVIPERSFAYFSLSDEINDKIIAGLSSDMTKIEVKYGEDVIFSTGYTVKSTGSTPTPETDISVSPKEEDPFYGKDILIAVMILFSLIIYTFIIWKIAAVSKRKRRYR